MESSTKPIWFLLKQVNRRIFCKAICETVRENMSVFDPPSDYGSSFINIHTFSGYLNRAATRQRKNHRNRSRDTQVTASQRKGHFSFYRFSQKLLRTFQKQKQSSCSVFQDESFGTWLASVACRQVP